MGSLEDIRAEVMQDSSNAWAAAAGYAPLFVADERARVLIISQAPGRLAQETGIPWNDPSGRLLRSWMGVTDDEFYDPGNVAIVPMDFYFPGKRSPGKRSPGERSLGEPSRGERSIGDRGPGKGTSGDLPPRQGFAARWHPPILELLTEVRLTILIGSYAQRHYLGSTGPATLTERVRAAESFLPLFPIVHPSPLARGWRTRNPWFTEHTVPLLAARVREALDSGR